MAAAAQRYGRPSGETELFPFLIHDLKIAFNAKWTIAEDCHFGSGHEFLRWMNTARNAPTR
jgi:hypothetical protein